MRNITIRLKWLSMTPTTPNPAPGLLSGEAFPTSLVDRVLLGLGSDNTRRSYRTGIDQLTAYAGDRPVTLTLLRQWRGRLAKSMAIASVNARVNAVRSFITEARRSGQISRELGDDLLELKALPNRGNRTGNWLDRDQAKLLLAVPDRKTKKGKRDYCILAILVGCGLRRDELAALELDVLQQREGRWVFSDLVGKGGRVRTVPVPAWVKHAIDSWTKAAEISSGPLLRSLRRLSDPLSDDSIWEVVRDSALAIGIEHFGPHDLRRTCAKLCRSRGGRIEQIQLLLGHASIQTTERYLGSTQNLKHAVNDDLGLY
jgi:integrase